MISRALYMLTVLNQKVLWDFNHRNTDFWAQVRGSLGYLNRLFNYHFWPAHQLPHPLTSHLTSVSCCLHLWPLVRSPSCLASGPANPITQHVFLLLFPSLPCYLAAPLICPPPPLFFLTLLPVSLSSVWDGIGVKNTPLPCPIPVSVPVLAPFPGSAVDFCRGAASVLSPALACRCLWRRHSWQREGSKMLGWNLGHMGSSPERGMVSPEGGSARSSHPTRQTGK